MLVEDGSHSIDQPKGKTLGQVKQVFESSKVIPENKVTSKTEYTNTQQDWPIQEYIYLFNLTYKAYKGSGFSFAEKQQRVDPYFQVLAFKFWFY